MRCPMFSVRDSVPAFIGLDPFLPARRQKLLGAAQSGQIDGQLNLMIPADIVGSLCKLSRQRPHPDHIREQWHERISGPLRGQGCTW